MRALLAFFALLFAGIAAWPWLAPLAASDAAPAEREPAAAAHEEGVLPPLESLRETLARPLFNPSRRPVPESADASGLAPVRVALAPAASAERSFAAYRLQGVVITRDQRKILLGPAGGGRPLVLQEGDEHDGWTVEKIEQEQITLRAGERREVLPLRRISR
ncbi:MAG: hypothetical protein KIT20_08960 [Alphaproteobacteria bacterium]|nr:hypothetical protein [Alphaproteobacteria bacterium]